MVQIGRVCVLTAASAEGANSVRRTTQWAPSSFVTIATVPPPVQLTWVKRFTGTLLSCADLTGKPAEGLS
jgi:hypothetical protein